MKHCGREQSPRPRTIKMFGGQRSRLEINRGLYVSIFYSGDNVDA